MPDFPIIDTHVHLWDPQVFRMPWLDNSPHLNKQFGPKEYWEHTKETQIEGFVYLEVAVEPAYSLLEAKWANAIAEQEPRLMGIVANAPLEYGEQVRLYLAELAAIGPRIKGVRRLLQGEADVNYCLQPRFVEGVQMLAEFGFSFDICIRHPQLAAAVELVKRCPNVQFIVDHIAKPSIKTKLFEPWGEQMREMASLPNVICKVSGATTEADWSNWTPADLEPYIAHVLEVFGEDRVAFGGDWPVVLHAAPHTRWVQVLDQLTSHLSPEAKRKLWAENGRRFYRLG